MSEAAHPAAKQVDTPVDAARPKTSAPRNRRLLLWPGVLIVALYWAIWGASTLVEGTPMIFMIVYMLLPMLMTLGLLIWWLFASRLSWTDRLLGVLAYVVAATVAAIVCGEAFPIMALIMKALAVVGTAWVGWLAFSWPIAWPIRRIGVLATIVLTWCSFMLLRFEGTDGEFKATYSWRWTPTAEERLLADLRQTSSAKSDRQDDVDRAPVEPLVLQPGDWAEFRGPLRDSRLHDVRIRTDWNENPPKELWRRRVGPGWSSFSVVGDHLFTQEQRGEEELVVCYDATSGDEIWTHADNDRFNEAVAGPGPRATPTFVDGKLYVLGATGILNCLDAASGKKNWSRDLKEDVKAAVPIWGFSASPLVVDGVVTVFAGGPEGKSTVAYKAENGDLLWAAGEGMLSYCSAQRATLGGVEQTLMATEFGLASFEPKTGEILWQHDWPTEGVVRICQPAILSDTDLVLGTGMGIGTRRIRVTRDGEAWKTEDLWTSKQFKPYFNDYVVHEGALYGFDGPIFACVDLEKGRVQWRERGYGSGQALLLAEQGLLIILTETGELALVEANPEERVELAKIPAIKGKTWNHPVVAHGRLFVRNGEEMVAFELPNEAAEK